MIWDRERRGPAQINMRLLIGMTNAEAVMLRDQLEAFYATSIGIGNEK